MVHNLHIDMVLVRKNLKNYRKKKKGKTKKEQQVQYQ